MSYNSQENHSHTIDNENLSEQIKAESISNFDQYVGNYENESVDGFVIDMKNYIYHKVYNSLFGDMVPMITSAVLRIEIIIVEMAAGRMNETKVSYNNYGTEPISHAYPVYVYKTGEHYDAIIPKSIAIASNSEKVTLASKKETSADPNYISRRHRAAHVESQIVPLFSQSLTISGVESVLNDARRRYEKCIVLGQ